MTIRNSIFATILYYDSFNFPLTFTEVYGYLINPKRLMSPHLASMGGVDVGAEDVAAELESMSHIGLIGHKNGFYFLNGRDDLYEQRIEKDKLAGIKWKKFLAKARFLLVSPYLRGVFVSGSLASNNPELKSDFDVFIIIKSGRLYTGRFFLWLISSLLGSRRGRFDVIAPDKLCFNHYIADNNLEMTHKSLYIAQSVLNMKPVIVFENILEKFESSNNWISSYCFNFRAPGPYRPIFKNSTIMMLPRLGESILNTFLGDILETVLKFIQQRRIRNNPNTHESGGRIIFNDKELEFHPRSFERTVISSYNLGLNKFGIFGFDEHDSGLG